MHIQNFPDVRAWPHLAGIRGESSRVLDKDNGQVTQLSVMQLSIIVIINTGNEFICTLRSEAFALLTCYC